MIRTSARPRRRASSAVLVAALVASATFVTASPSAFAAVQQFCNATAIAIPDSGAAAPYPSEIDVLTAGLVAKVTVELLGISHTFPEDIDVLLVGPTGNDALIMSDVGSNLPVTDVDLTLDDDAAAPIPTPLVTGTFLPTNLVGVNGVEPDAFDPPAPMPSGNVALGTFIGTQALGTWSLFVMDDIFSDTGQFAGGWCLNIIFDPDFGDAPDTYSTLLASGGPRHGGSALFLGACVSAEPDGQPTADASGDDCDDGVTFGTLRQGQDATVNVVASAPGLLDAFVDFNRDGDFAGAGEKIFTSVPLLAGTNALTLPVPASALVGTTFARFRVSTDGGLSFGGFADDGEVEDYQITILSPTAPEPDPTPTPTPTTPTPTPTPPTANGQPVFTLDSPCGGSALFPVIGGTTNVQVRASDPNAGQTVHLASSTLPGWASFSSSPGNPATGALEGNPGLLDLISGFLMGPTLTTIRATDNASPQAFSDCTILLQVTLLRGII